VFDDDGAGPHPAELVAGGAFLGHVLKWNGTVWTSLGSGIDGDVHALAVFDDDGPGPHGPALYAGGTFAHAGGASAMNVARWDGASWTPLGVGTTSTVRALATFDPDGAGPAPRELCAGGDFTFAGGLGALHVARWNGTSWSDLAGGTDGGVRALAEHDDDGAGPGAPALYVGGAFGNAGTTPASRIARWNGSSWSALAQGVDDAVDSLTEFDPRRERAAPARAVRRRGLHGGRRRRGEPRRALGRRVVVAARRRARQLDAARPAAERAARLRLGGLRRRRRRSQGARAVRRRHLHYRGTSRRRERRGLGRRLVVGARRRAERDRVGLDRLRRRRPGSARPRARRRRRLHRRGRAIREPDRELRRRELVEPARGDERHRARADRVRRRRRGARSAGPDRGRRLHGGRRAGERHRALGTDRRGSRSGAG
jgi:hypothetical protein